ncbi:hypothetical protein R6Q59_031814 [Mikania micrantha]
MLERFLTFSTVLSFKKPLAFQLSLVQDLAKKKGVSREKFSFLEDPKEYGFEPSHTPRTDKSVSKNIELGLAALQGEKGPAYDRIVLNAGMTNPLLGCTGAEDVATALDRARDTIDSGAALNRLLNYLKMSHKVKMNI